MEYIRLLEQRNRLKRTTGKTREQERLEAREKGFDVLFAGANEERLSAKQDQRKHPVGGHAPVPKDSSTHTTMDMDRTHGQALPQQPRGRNGVGNGRRCWSKNTPLLQPAMLQVDVQPEPGESQRGGAIAGGPTRGEEVEERLHDSPFPGQEKASPVTSVPEEMLALSGGGEEYYSCGDDKTQDCSSYRHQDHGGPRPPLTRSHSTLAGHGSAPPLPSAQQQDALLFRPVVAGAVELKQLPGPMVARECGGLDAWANATSATDSVFAPSLSLSVVDSVETASDAVLAKGDNHSQSQHSKCDGSADGHVSDISEDLGYEDDGFEKDDEEGGHQELPDRGGGGDGHAGHTARPGPLEAQAFQDCEAEMKKSNWQVKSRARQALFLDPIRQKVLEALHRENGPPQSQPLRGGERHMKETDVATSHDKEDPFSSTTGALIGAVQDLSRQRQRTSLSALQQANRDTGHDDRPDAKLRLSVQATRDTSGLGGNCDVGATVSVQGTLSSATRAQEEIPMDVWSTPRVVHSTGGGKGPGVGDGEERRVQLDKVAEGDPVPGPGKLIARPFSRQSEESSALEAEAPLLLRMRNAWGTSLVGLAGLSLHQAGAPETAGEEIHAQALPLSAACLTLQTGRQVIPRGSRMYRDLGQLLRGSNGTGTGALPATSVCSAGVGRAALWSGRIPEHTPLDLVITHPLLTGVLQGKTKILLKVTNCTSSQAQARGAQEGPGGVRDMDVYLASRCVWSGVVPEAGEVAIDIIMVNGRGHNHAATSALALADETGTAHHRGEATPPQASAPSQAVVTSPPPPVSLATGVPNASPNGTDDTNHQGQGGQHSPKTKGSVPSWLHRDGATGGGSAAAAQATSTFVLEVHPRPERTRSASGRRRPSGGHPGTSPRAQEQQPVRVSTGVAGGPRSSLEDAGEGVGEPSGAAEEGSPFNNEPEGGPTPGASPSEGECAPLARPSSPLSALIDSAATPGQGDPSSREHAGGGASLSQRPGALGGKGKGKGTGNIPSFDEGSKRRPRDSELEASWESLAVFSRTSRSRLAAAGASFFAKGGRPTPATLGISRGAERAAAVDKIMEKVQQVQHQVGAMASATTGKAPTLQSDLHKPHGRQVETPRDFDIGSTHSQRSGVALPAHQGSLLSLAGDKSAQGNFAGASSQGVARTDKGPSCQAQEGEEDTEGGGEGRPGVGAWAQAPPVQGAHTAAAAAGAAAAVDDEDGSVPETPLWQPTPAAGQAGLPLALPLELEIEESSFFDCPVLPQGQVLTLVIESTWGDMHYVGMAGIDIFNDGGHKVTVRDPKTQVTADPADINVLPEYQSDPRTVDKLLDGVSHTSDDLHQWLAPFEPGCNNRVSISLDRPITLGALRLWNYNKSRTHSYRGVRCVGIMLDSRLIFHGEIRKAAGMLAPAEQCSEVILFSLDEKVLQAVQGQQMELAARDDIDTAGDAVTLSVVREVQAHLYQQRPTTATDGQGVKGGGSPPAPATLRHAKRAPMEDAADTDSHLGHRMDTGLVRPHTAAVPSLVVHGDQWGGHESDHGAAPTVGEIGRGEREHAAPAALSSSWNAHTQPPAQVEGLHALPKARKISLSILSTWGDPDFCGLTGVQVLQGAERRPMTLSAEAIHVASTLSSAPSDMPVGNLGDSDYRTPDKLLNGNNRTCHDYNMWLSVFRAREGQSMSIVLDLGGEHLVSGVRVWNYNKSEEDSVRGVRHVSLALDGQEVGTFVLRPGPGNDFMDFGQTILLDEDSARERNRVRQGNQPHMTTTTTNGHGNGDDDGGGGTGVTHVGPRASRTGVGTPFLRQDYETLLWPGGQLLRLVVHSTWGDPYYVGLDGLQLVQPDGTHIHLRPEQVCAVPRSLQVLGQEDGRVPGNLVDGVYGDKEGQGHHSWLAPLAASLDTSVTGTTFKVPQADSSGMAGQVRENQVYILLDEPIALALIRIWNYRKTPRRGVRDFSLSLNGALLFMGRLPKAPAPPCEYAGTPILFTNDPSTVQRERLSVAYGGVEQQDVLCIDERQVRVRSKAACATHQESTWANGFNADLAQRPGTAITNTHLRAGTLTRHALS